MKEQNISELSMIFMGSPSTVEYIKQVHIQIDSILHDIGGLQQPSRPTSTYDEKKEQEARKESIGDILHKWNWLRKRLGIDEWRNE